MSKLSQLTILLFVIAVVFHSNADGQYVSKKLRTKHQAYTDSLKQVKYDYIFPILGQEAYSQGFDIPYPAGMMANYMWMRQGILIDNLQLGLLTDNRDVPLTEVDFIQFGENTNTSNVVNVRPDIWILPFLNVYGIFGYGTSHTEVNLVAPVELKSVVDQGISTAGVGVMTAFGVGPVWMSVDANWTWSKPELLDEAVKVSILGMRVGHTFTFEDRPDRNIAIWAGGMRASMSSATTGAVTMIDALPSETWERRDEIVAKYWNWYNALDPNNPGDAARIKAADEILTPIVDRIEAADGNAVIRYGMDKQVKEMWNGIVGFQFQLNKSWMFRAEAGVIGDRKSFLASINYRFLL